jgi:hypothetical protein
MRLERNTNSCRHKGEIRSVRSRCSSLCHGLLFLFESCLDFWQLTNDRSPVDFDNVLLVRVGKTFECCNIKMISQLNRVTSLRRKTHSSIGPVFYPVDGFSATCPVPLSAKLHHHPISQTSCPWSCSSNYRGECCACSISSDSVSCPWCKCHGSPLQRRSRRNRWMGPRWACVYPSERLQWRKLIGRGSGCRSRRRYGAMFSSRRDGSKVLLLVSMVTGGWNGTGVDEPFRLFATWRWQFGDCQFKIWKTKGFAIGSFQLLQTKSGRSRCRRVLEPPVQPA